MYPISIMVYRYVLIQNEYHINGVELAWNSSSSSPIFFNQTKKNRNTLEPSIYD